MSRSNYCEDIDHWALLRWRGAVASAIKGARGQKLLSEMATALDAMPEKRLIAGELKSGGEVCALGCLAQFKGLDVSRIDPEDPDQVAKAFGVAPALAQEVAFMNDEAFYRITPEERWNRMRKWVSEQLKPSP